MHLSTSQHGRGGGSRALWVWRRRVFWLSLPCLRATRSSWLRQVAMCSAVSEQSPSAAVSLIRTADLGLFSWPMPGGLSGHLRDMPPGTQWGRPPPCSPSEGEGTRAPRGLQCRWPPAGLSDCWLWAAPAVGVGAQVLGTPSKMK